MLRGRVLLDRFKKYVNTARYMQAGQITGQLTKTKKINRRYTGALNTEHVNWNLDIAIPELDENATFLQRFNVDEIESNIMTLLYETHVLNLNTWQVDAPALWRFNLHYFEYGIALAAEYKKTDNKVYYNKFKELVIKWIETHHEPIGDAWHPYTISMRIPNWLIALDLFGEIFDNDVQFKSIIVDSIYRQYRTLNLRQETWQLGNHYFENLKTMILGSLFFGEEFVFLPSWEKFMIEINEEVLPDGMHFELSPMYHKIILEDIIRIANWLKQCGKNKEYNFIVPYIDKMSTALYMLEAKLERTPLFNDSGGNVAKSAFSLLKTVQYLFGIEPTDINFLNDGGYYKLYNEDVALLFDAGEIGPRYIPGHSHCDCLSFELTVRGRPLFVNSGTNQYQGELRTFFRSTEANNTVMIDGRQQSEMWKEHRVARRITNTFGKYNDGKVEGHFTSFSGDKFSRTLEVKDKNIIIKDFVMAKDKQRHVLIQFMHLAPNIQYKLKDSQISAVENGQAIADITIPKYSKAIIHSSGAITNYACDFGKLQHKEVLEIRSNFFGKTEAIIFINIK